MPRASDDTVLVLFGNQLFPPEHLAVFGARRVFMAEDPALCREARYHKHKLVLVLAAMRAHADALRTEGYEVHYEPLKSDGAERGYEQKLDECLSRKPASRIAGFAPESYRLAARLARFAGSRGLALERRESPMFLTARAEFDALAGPPGKTLRMGDFYRRQRRRLGLLLDAEGGPRGGVWSFDAENRKRLPPDVVPPGIAAAPRTEHVEAVAALVDELFAGHPGETRNFWLPTTRAQALSHLHAFVASRLERFGDFEDALSTREPFLFHSALSPLLNVGLLTPGEVLDAVLEADARKGVPLNSLEGFVRQLVGWREFVRGVHHRFRREQAGRNVWGHRRRLTHHWYDGTTGLRPLDDAIAKASRLGWLHHIERLMVVGNVMLLAEIEPGEAHRWFMEMFVDSAAWVMGPNVYGMALYSDGGLLATKPYICASSYLLKMSDTPRGEWCDTLDGLYWRFVARHRETLTKNPRTSMIARAYGRLAADRKARIFEAAEKFLGRCTEEGK